MPNSTDGQVTREDVAEHCRQLAALGVTIAGSGNVSARCGETVLISRGSLRLEQATAEDISVVDLDGRLLDGQRPSSETGLHTGIYRTTDAAAIVHTHGRSSVAVGLVLDELPKVHYAIRRLGGRVPTVPYYVFGSSELAAAVGEAVREGVAAVLMRNHGAVYCGTDLAQAMENAQIAEWLCQVYLDARQLGQPAGLTDAELEAVRTQAIRIARGPSVDSNRSAS